MSIKFISSAFALSFGLSGGVNAADLNRGAGEFDLNGADLVATKVIRSGAIKRNFQGDGFEEVANNVVLNGKIHPQAFDGNMNGFDSNVSSEPLPIGLLL